MIKEAPAVKVRQNLDELLNEVQFKRDSVVNLKDGKRVAALVEIGRCDRIRAMEERFAAITSKSRKENRVRPYFPLPWRARNSAAVRTSMSI